VIKRHSAPSAYEELARRADLQRLSSPHQRVITPAGARHTGARGARM
jgi:hypothetical protein